MRDVFVNVVWAATEVQVAAFDLEHSHDVNAKYFAKKLRQSTARLDALVRMLIEDCER